jgi:hypothetical protein
MRILLAPLALAVLLFAGCGGKTVSLPSPVAASGKVTFANGQPVKNVRVFFQPVDAMSGASCLLNEDGSFSLQTYDNKQGACPGKYRVIFQVHQGTQAELNRSQLALRSIPVKYTQDDSPLQVEVPSGGKTDFELRLDAR